MPPRKTYKPVSPRPSVKFFPVQEVLSDIHRIHSHTLRHIHSYTYTHTPTLIHIHSYTYTYTTMHAFALLSALLSALLLATGLPVATSLPIAGSSTAYVPIPLPLPLPNLTDAAYSARLEGGEQGEGFARAVLPRGGIMDEKGIENHGRCAVSYFTKFKPLSDVDFMTGIESGCVGMEAYKHFMKCENGEHPDFFVLEKDLKAGRKPGCFGWCETGTCADYSGAQ